MVILRAVRLEDIDQLWGLIEQSTYGLTTLQITKDQLTERVELSHFAFTRKTEKAAGDLYVFVMEDVKRRKLVGTSCIFSKTGGYEPFYSYRRIVETQASELLGITRRVESLQLAKIHDGPTEIGSLFLLPEYRGEGRGRLLSLARFIFMARHPKRFSNEVIAEMRGVVNEDGSCPFWDAVGRHFFQMEFPQADSLSTVDKRFIEDLMPRHPIYTCLLPPSAREVLSQVHVHTRPALAMLQAEGFSISDMIDIFDGGPVVHCRRESIGAVMRTRDVPVSEIGVVTSPASMIAANCHLGFRSTMAVIEQVTGGVRIAAETADLLELSVGKTLTVLPTHPTPELAKDLSP